MDASQAGAKRQFDALAQKNLGWPGLNCLAARCPARGAIDAMLHVRNWRLIIANGSILQQFFSGERMSHATIWWILTGSLVIAELLTGTFYLLMLAIGAAAGAMAAIFSGIYCPK